MVKRPTESPYFTGKRSDVASCLPFPSISAPSFGLIQEKLAHDPFRLLLATVFLNRTRGEEAIPVLDTLFQKYPTVNAWADADFEGLVSTIRVLGFQNSRAKKCIALAKLWAAAPPAKGRRFRRLHYPNKCDGLDIRPGECIDDNDARVAWEVAHLPGIGAYAIDSWRIFCRDELRGLASGWNGVGVGHSFTPEWKSVLPQDKELRAFLSWMWLKEGWMWDCETGERIPSLNQVLHFAERGNIVLQKLDGTWVLHWMGMKKILSINTAV